jgi:hypothetical protein
MTPMRILLAAAAAIALGGAAFAEDVAGKWTGILVNTQGEVPITITIAKGADGKLSGVGEAPSGQVGLEKIISDGKSLEFDVVKTGHYKGTWDATKKTWTGMLAQNGLDLPMTLSRAAQ